MSKKWKKPPLATIRAEAVPSAFTICGASEGFEIQAQDSGERKLKRFSMTAYTGAAMNVGFGVPVVVDLEGMDIPSQGRPILRSHDSTQIVGHTDSIEKSQQRLKVSGVISGVGEAAQEVIALSANGFPWQASIGASADRMERVPDGESVKVNGRNFKGPIYVARKTTLGEISFVPVGADGATSASVAASLKGQTMFEQWLQAKGIDAATYAAYPEVTKLALQAAHKAETAPATVAVQPVGATPAVQASKHTEGLDEILARQQAENARCQEISRIVASTIAERPDMTDTAGKLGRLAIDGKWDVQRFELELLRASRHTGGVLGYVRSEPDAVVNGSVIECAVAKHGQLPNREKLYDERTLEAADRQFKYGLSLTQLLLHFAHRNGYRGNNIRDTKAVLKAAFREDQPQDIRASGPSTYLLSGILSNVANKFLRDAFNSVEDTWRRITAIRSVNDFKQITTYSLTGDNQYTQVPAGGGPIDHGTLNEESYTNQANTFAKMLGIDRRDLINDDLGAFTNVNRRLGRGGALKINDVFWTEFMADASTFYTSARGNYDDGASDTLMDLTGLANAHTLFQLQTDPDGKPLGAIPAIVLVPPQLWATAWTLLMSPQLNLATSTAASTGTMSPWVGMFRLERSAYLANSSYTGYSAAAWYMLCDPNDIPVIETVFLNGVETPTVESSDADFDTLGIQIRAYHDFGCNKQEYRGGVKMKGAA